MAEDAKTKKVGFIETAKAKKLPGWAKYLEVAKASVEARKAAGVAKKGIRDHITKTLELSGNIDFTVNQDGSVTIIENLEQKKPRAASAVNLSDKF